MRHALADPKLIPAMQAEIIPSDVAILDILRKRDAASVAELATWMQVTSTAVRQRLTRLMAQGYIDRITVRAGRGRPSHHYVLTKQGRRKTGSNFADLAMALWQEVREIADVEIRRGLSQRIARRLAQEYAPHIRGETLEEKAESLAELFSTRQIPFEVDATGDFPILTALACPYPNLAEEDRTICSMERVLFSELLGETVQLDKCRLDGEHCCTFNPHDDRSDSEAPNETARLEGTS
ncbi:MAG: MarR family transcriptional regulator [Pirellulaceae bacterium]|nr:MarR family transcriptional regulator [Pirellulaceae bacterium]HJN12440.1 MarR family transcriptional regulator [Pirellulaceae bacterium]